MGHSWAMDQPSVRHKEDGQLACMVEEEENEEE